MTMKIKLLALVRSLRDRAFRATFVETEIESIIPFQIRAMRKRLGWNQEQLAEKAGMTQARISVLESPSYEGAVNVKTLLKLAAAFDVGLIVRFAPFGEVAEWSSRLSRENHEVPTYEMELAALEKATTEPPCNIRVLKSSGFVTDGTPVFGQTNQTNAA